MDSKLLARSMRYAIARKAVAEALIGQEVALAKAGVLERSRRRLISQRMSACAVTSPPNLHDGVHERLLALKGQLQEFLKGIGSASESTRLLSNVIDGLNQKIEQQVGVLSRQLYPSSSQRGARPGLSVLSRSVWNRSGRRDRAG